ncbi:MAG TPA: flagellar hook capping FlgD N-terminal domain-containing protein [Stellaceae bacterium]|nr:flagellar hook capping FlgD N-terminal domain-containing protein [Stellaceae bacterium]
MTVTPVTSTPTPATTPSSSSATSNTANGTSNGVLNFTQNFNTFLTLLTTQLQNQDPLSPMDTDQFTNQLVEFASVEQQINTNSNLKTMIANQSGSEAISALPVVGQEIQYNGNQTVLQNGQAGFSYTLPTTAASASLQIKDASGNIVFSEPISPNAGTQNFIWNGQTSAGTQEPDGGIYAMSITAASSTNTPITATTTAIGQVTGVSVNNNVADFTIGNSTLQVPMNSLLSVLGSSSSSSTASN